MLEQVLCNQIVELGFDSSVIGFWVSIFSCWCPHLSVPFLSIGRVAKVWGQVYDGISDKRHALWTLNHVTRSYNWATFFIVSTKDENEWKPPLENSQP